MKISKTTPNIGYLDTRYLKLSDATTTYVPYTGATGDVNLGANDLTLGQRIVGTNASSLSFYGKLVAGTEEQGADITMTAGPGNGTRNGGGLLYMGGTGGSTGNGGGLSFTGGTGGSTSGNGGNVVISGGEPSAGNSNGGDVQFYTGLGSGSGTGGRYMFHDPDQWYAGIFDFSNLASSDKTFTFPNATGTLALTSDSSMVKESVDSGDTVTIPSGYQMMVYDQLTVEGTLNIEGKLIIIPDGIIS